MDKLDESQQQIIETYHKDINQYQTDQELYSNLKSEQYPIIAELQTIYNTLKNKESLNDPGLLDIVCVGIKNEMKQFTEMYAGKDANYLYEIYVKKYQEAKRELKKD